MSTVEIVTYRAADLSAARPGFEWLAYVVLLNGEYWGVCFHGETEEIAKTKAIRLWNSERAKRGLNQKPTDNKPFVKSPKPSPDSSEQGNSIAGDPWAFAKQHHRAGKIWMRHKENRDLISIPITEIAMYEKQGYERGGPRSK